MNTPMVSYQGGSYSVPHRLLGETVWVRVHGTGRDERIIMVHVGPGRCGRGRPAPTGRTRQPADPSTITSRRPRRVRCTGNPSPAAPRRRRSSSLGAGAALWLKEAAAQGTSRIRVKMDHAVSIAKLTDPGRVDWALGHAAVHQRFGEGDLVSILTAHPDPAVSPPARRAGETRSLTQGTTGWAALGATTAARGGTSATDVNGHNNSRDNDSHHHDFHLEEDHR